MALWGLAIFAALAAALNLFFSGSEFAGFDVSPLIDSGWRVMNGQLPNVDFLCTFPPSTYLLVDLAFHAFGVRWVSLILAEDLLYLVLSLLGLRLCCLLLKEGRSRASLAWVFVGAQTVLMLSVTHLWHSTTAAGLAAYAVLASCALLKVSTSKLRCETTLHLVLAFSMLLLSKPNTAFAAVLFCMLCLLSARGVRAYVCVALLAAGTVDFFFLAHFHISAADVLRGYAGLGGRAFPRYFLVGVHPWRSVPGEISVLLTYGLLAFAVRPGLRAVWSNRMDVLHSPSAMLCVSAAGVSVIGLGTNFDVKLADVAPFLVGAGLLATMQPDLYGKVLRHLRWSVLGLVLLATLIGAARVRMKADGPWAGGAYGPGVQLNDAFFGGLKAREAMATALREIDGVVAQSPQKRIFFGPSIEFSYAREKLISPRMLPLWWHKGTSYPAASEAQLVEHWKRDNFDIVILEKSHWIELPRALRDEIGAHCSLDQRYREIDVYRRVVSP